MWTTHGISEWLDLLSIGPARRADTVPPAGTTLHLYATAP